MISLQLAGGSAPRPSDALNLALRLKARILVAPEVMNAQSVLPNQLEAKPEDKIRPVTFKWVSAPAPSFGPLKFPPDRPDA